MMVRECRSTSYVLFLIVIVPASDHKDLFVECVTMHKADMGMLS
jgi:hypothetical protein